MFSVEPPDKNTLDVFSRYLQSRSFFLLTEDGKSAHPEKRFFSETDARLISEKFARAEKCAGIGRRHGSPMLYHFIITEIKNGSAATEYSILENIEDLPRMIEHLFFTASFFQKQKLQTLCFPCIADFKIQGFEIQRNEDCLIISETVELK